MSTMDAAVGRTELPGLPVRRGKVRDIYDLGDEILLVATDRISAFDVVLPSLIPGKGRLLTEISAFWFDWLGDRVQHHLLERITSRAPVGLEAHLDQLSGRTLRCLRTEVVPIECVVRGYLAGSGFLDYMESGEVCGVKLPPGLKRCDKLPEPIFTPATKESQGHDLNIDFDHACGIAGRETMETLRERSIRIYELAAAHALKRGIIIADTKFEWGFADEELILVDEALTPDSSRFWPADQYEPGRDQASFDKQYVRNYLETLSWSKTPPGPRLPDDVVANTSRKYIEAYERLTGEAFPTASA